MIINQGGEHLRPWKGTWVQRRCDGCDGRCRIGHYLLWVGKTIIMPLFCTTKSDWNLYSEAGAFQDQVPLRCLRVQERGTWRSCRRFRQGVQADVYAIQQRLQHRLRPLGVRRLTSTTDLHRFILSDACVFSSSYPISKSWNLYAYLKVIFFAWKYLIDTW